MSQPDRTRIKICGLSTEADVAAAVDAGADAVGFVLYQKSVRHVSLERAVALSRGLPAFVRAVLLLVNPSETQLREALDALPQAMPQFHGDEPPALCDSIGRGYLRSVAMARGVDLLDWAHRYVNADALLLDAPVDGYGGGGKVFDWSLLSSVRVPARLVLSGGLDAANVIDGVRRVRPFAVDVSSGVERTRGVKDAQLIRAFCEAVREADARIADAGT